MSEAREQHHFESDELRASVVRCARDARRAGVPPEHLLVALKTIVRESAIADVRDWFRAVVTDRIVVWAVEAYYGIDDGDAEGTASR